MSINYPLNLLNSADFENLVISICNRILGIGTIGFTSGRDGGRDGTFNGAAQSFPSTQSPWKGKFIIQAKHTEKPHASCSDSDFNNIVEREIQKIKILKEKGEIDYYLIFTNRRLAGGKNSDIITKIVKNTGIKEAFIFADNTIQQYLVAYPEIAKQYGLQKFLQPFEFYDEDICDVIKAFPEPEEISLELDKNKKWLFAPKEEKNTINKLSQDYFHNTLLEDIKYFDKIEMFLKDPANNKLKKKYNETVYELRRKIETYHSQYDAFEKIFDVLFDYIFYRNIESLKTNRSLIAIFLHYMYFICDIGKKEKNENS